MKLVFVAILLSISGCASDHSYSKTGVVSDQFDKDTSECKYETTKSVGFKKNVTDLIMASSREEKIMTLCMESKGYKISEK